MKKQESKKLNMSLPALLGRARAYGSIRVYMNSQDIERIDIVQNSIYVGSITQRDILFTSIGDHEKIAEQLSAPVFVATRVFLELYEDLYLDRMDGSRDILNQSKVLNVQPVQGKTAEYLLIKNTLRSWIVLFDGSTLKMEGIEESEGDAGIAVTEMLYVSEDVGSVPYRLYHNLLEASMLNFVDIRSDEAVLGEPPMVDPALL